MKMHPDVSEEPPEPVERPVMYQSWCNLTFLHWRYPARTLAALLPRGLEVDTFDGEAWLGLTPFVVSGLRPPYLPRVPWLSRFPETNVRTYVLGPDGKRGIWFFTLEASRLLAVTGARLIYGLPYRWTRMTIQSRGQEREYLLRRHYSKVMAAIRIVRGAPIEADALTRFLTARFRLYSTHGGRLIAAQVDHPPWPLESASLGALSQNLIESCGLPSPGGSPLVHFSPGVRVRVGGPELLAIP